MRMSARVVTRLVGFFLAMSALVLAQTATTSCAARSTTPKEPWSPGASVTINDPATGFSRTTKSDGQGNYQFLELPPAKYDLTVDARGFATMKQRGVGVAGGQSGHVEHQYASHGGNRNGGS